MTWEIFERAAGRYEHWYATPRGRRADRAEGALLAWLLAGFPGARRVLEVGSGTGHFARWLTAHGYRVVGLDRSPAMLREADRLPGGGSLLLGDAHQLPVRDRAIDLVLLVTALEFLEQPERALRESVRVADRGVAVLALNRWSPGAVARRWHPSRGALVSRAEDRSLPHLRRELAAAAGGRLRALRWRCTLLPRPLDGLVSAVPLGDVIGMAIELDGSG
jgi:ubiquinone/menaquinone biosynthesis C-methylase UbiE